MFVCFAQSRVNKDVTLFASLAPGENFLPRENLRTVWDALVGAWAIFEGRSPAAEASGTYFFEKVFR